MVYVDTVTPSLQQYQDSLRDYSGVGGSTNRQRANDWASMYYQNAQNIAMMNYQNEYNSPLQQMLRYQAAGLNPYLVQTEPGNMSSIPSAGNPHGSTDQGAKDVQTLFQGMNTVIDSLKTAQQMYDYVKYGRSLSEYNTENAYWNSIFTQNRAYRESAEADWAQYWNTGIAKYPHIESSPRAIYMNNSTEAKAQQIEQLKALVNVIYPSQSAQNNAREALTTLQKEILEGQKGAVLQINTGSDTWDSILQMVAYWILNR